jgi:hypothetical protein
MKSLHINHPLRIFLISGILTLLIGGWVFGAKGALDLWTFVILVLLEVTFSFDNAVINSKILGRMSKFWQSLFLTVGIVFAVFVVRFVLPILIVMLSSNHSFMGVVDLALNRPEQYSETLHEAAPIINGFGGTFLLMLGISYFMDRNKDIHWLRKIERWMSKIGRYESFKSFVMLFVALILYATVDPSYREIVLVASIVGTIVHIGLELFGDYFSSKQSSAKQMVGMAAFASFVYLNVLDMSFSLDGVIGAFAITNDVILIMAGLGAGALWVRSLTVYLTRTGTLAKYRYLEHGAHWAILALGVVMLVKLYHVEPPEWFVGSIGIIFVATAVVSSIIERQREKRAIT